MLIHLLEKVPLYLDGGQCMHKEGSPSDILSLEADTGARIQSHGDMVKRMPLYLKYWDC